MTTSSRASPPPPLALGVTPTKVTTAPVHSSTPRPTDTVRRSLTGDSSFSSLQSPGSSSSSRKPASPTSSTVNAHSYCGRHTNQYLFGGRRVSDLFRAIARRD